MFGRFSVRLVVMVAAVVMPVGLLALPAQAAPKPKVTIKVSKKSVAPGKKFSTSGKVSKKAKGARVTLERSEGGSWRAVTRGKVAKNGTYKLKARAVVGSHKYRVKVAGTKKTAATKSKSVKVKGTFKKSVSYPYKGQKISLKAQTNASGGTKVMLQEKRDKKWVDVASGKAKSDGSVDVKFTVSSTSMKVRFRVLQKSTKGAGSAAGNTPTHTVKAASKTAGRILNDINSRRASNGKKPLKLHKGMSDMSQAWARVMYDGCFMEHNTNYAEQTPGKWTRVGENIARGYAASKVVTAWYKSQGHKENMLGDFTHLGVGAVMKNNPDCHLYTNYYVTNFAKY